MNPRGQVELDYSVIVPTRNRHRQLGLCLEALAKLEYPRDRFEVLVVDDGGSPSLEPLTTSWTPHLRVRLLRQAHTGPAKARNRGAREARGRWLAFLDDDCLTAPEWLSGFAAAGASEQEAMGGATRNAVEHKPCSVASHVLVEYVCVWLRRHRSPLAFFPSNNLAVSREVFLRIGGFSERFPLAAAEDREFCSRWLRRGGALRYVPEAPIRHMHDLDLGPFCRQHFCYGRGAATFRKILASEGWSSGRQPRGFYTGMLGTAWRSGSGLASVLTVALVLLSQASYACGFSYERLARVGNRRSRSTAAGSPPPASSVG